jgi:subtilase family serine protease
MLGASLTVAAHAQVRVGNVLIPASSIQHPGDAGVRAHTNYRILIGPPGGREGFYGGGGPGGGLTPSQLQQAYNLPSTGGSQIIAVVDAFDNPNALSDFNVFSQQFGLPIETSANATSPNNQVFQVLYANGAQPPADPTGGWELEESLDVQWAHAMAPNAKIVLVEADSNSDSDLYGAIDAATAYIDGKGLTAKEISNSWGGGEFFGEFGWGRWSAGRLP